MCRSVGINARSTTIPRRVRGPSRTRWTVTRNPAPRSRSMRPRPRSRCTCSLPTGRRRGSGSRRISTSRISRNESGHTDLRRHRPLHARDRRRAIARDPPRPHRAARGAYARRRRGARRGRVRHATSLRTGHVRARDRAPRGLVRRRQDPPRGARERDLTRARAGRHTRRRRLALRTAHVHQPPGHQATRDRRRRRRVDDGAREPDQHPRPRAARARAHGADLCGARRSTAMTWVSAGVAVGSAVIGASQAKKTKKAQDKEAQANSEFEASRAAKTNLVQGQVDAAYNSPARQQQYGTFAGALRDFYGQALDKKKLQATQQLKFGLAKQGQIGGSQQVDRGRLLGEEMTNAATGNERQVQSALANLKGNDEQSRIALRNQAGAGLQLNQVASRAAESEKQNIGT